MNDLEQRLGAVVERVSHDADPALARLRNPAENRQQPARAGILRSHPLLAPVAATVVVAGVALGVAGAVSRSDQQPTPAIPASVAQGQGDGVHPLWSLESGTVPARDIDQLAAARGVSLPVPHTLDPALVPDVVGAPTLVTAAGAVRFTEPDTRSVVLLAQRGKQTFVVLTGSAGSGADGLHDARFLLVSADNSKRQVYSVAYARAASVSPDGTMLAVTTRAGVDLVAVSSGKVAHTLPGAISETTWASERALLVRGADDTATSSVWRAPWTGAAAQLALTYTAGLAVDGGILAVDDASGCLRRLDAEGRITAANCNGWRSAGAASPDGRYVPLEWRGANGDLERGVLDVVAARVRTWPVNGVNPSWVGATTVLLTEADAEDQPSVARCDLTTDACEQVTSTVRRGAWRGADWLGR